MNAQHINMSYVKHVRKNCLPIVVLVLLGVGAGMGSGERHLLGRIGLLEDTLLELAP
ncbi:MAG: hypothetical protein AABZ06_04755 [Bdellovibrionota bacterium]